MTKKLDTSAKLRDVMEKLVISVVEEAHKLKMKDSFDQKVEVIKVATNYLSMVNKQPEEAEGADILKLRGELGEGAGGGGSDGDGAGDPDEREGDPDADFADPRSPEAQAA